MTLRTLLSSTSLSLLIAGGPAFADVTGPDVWEDWKAYMRGFGYEMSGTETQSGDTLTINDIEMSYALPEGEGSFSIAMDSLALTTRDDGTVSVDLPATMPMSFDTRPSDGESASGTLLYTQDMPTMIVSGEAGDMTYTYNAASVGMALQDLVVDGTPLTADMMAVSINMTDVANITRMTVGEMRDYAQTLSAAKLSYDISFNIPEPEANRGSFNGSMTGLAFDGTGTLPTDTNVEEMDAMLAQGFDVDGGFAYESGVSNADMITPDGPFKATTSSNGGDIRVRMGEGGLAYDVSQTDLAVDVQQMPNLPFPVSLNLAKSAFNLMVPLQPSDEPQDFALGFTLGDFTISDGIWNIFDPAGQLPRDPATIDLDLTGEAKVLVNVFDPEQAAAMDRGAAPGEVNALDINALLIRLAGAQLTGSGAFTFDNSDMTTFPGVPRPEGSVDVRVKGANKLIDTLVQMGLLPEEQAMGARMMMGLFGVPQGDDVLTSKIEVNEQGHVLANGQRLQ